MAGAPIVLVPGFWLGAWAWDEVADALRADGHDVTAVTLPGLESADADRSTITFADHVDAICAAVEAAEKPLPSMEELAEEENLDGLSEEQLETFRRRAVPQPGAALREGAELTNDARLDVPTTII